MEPAEPDRSGFDAVLRLVASTPAARVLALDDAAVRVPLPDALLAEGCVEFDDTGRTVMDFVDEADRMALVVCWERARSTGRASVEIRLTGRARRDHRVTIVDCRDRFGVWIEVLAPVDADGHRPHPAPRPIELPTPRPALTCVVHKNLSAVITAVDGAASSMLGWGEQEMVGVRSLEFVHPDDQQRAIAQWLEMRDRRHSQRIRLRHARRDGTWAWVDIENEFVGLDRPDEVVAVARMTDVSDEMAAIEALHRHERLLSRITESLPVGVVQFDRHREVVFYNGRAAAMLGSAGPPSWAGLVTHVEPGHRAMLHQVVAEVTHGGADRTLEVQVALPGDRRVRRYHVTVAALSAETGEPGALVSITDVTPAAQLREQLRIQATHDPLTGCLNRAAFLGELGRVLAGPDRAGVAVVFLDLDHFKSVNDTFGHAVGDQLLMALGRRLIDDARPGQVVGRFGGDELVVLRTDIADDDRARRAVDQVRHVLCAPIRLAGAVVRPGASIGIARAGPSSTPYDLIRDADEAMYRAKRHRRRGP